MFPIRRDGVHTDCRLTRRTCDTGAADHQGTVEQQTGRDGKHGWYLRASPFPVSSPGEDGVCHGNHRCGGRVLHLFDEYSPKLILSSRALCEA